MEAENIGPDAVGKFANKGVVVAQSVVVAAARHANSVFRAGQLILQTHELLAGAQLRVVFGQREQPSESGIELAVCGDLRLGVARIQQAGAGVGNVAKYRAFLLGNALHGLNQVGNQVGAAL